MAARSGTVIIKILGDASPLKKSLDDAEGRLGGFSSKTGSIAKGIAGAFAGLGIGVALRDATKAAAEDEQAQAKLAKTLENVVGASNATVSGVERQIAGFQKVSTFADDQLRPAFANLARSTKDVGQATDLMKTAMDIAAARGLPLEQVSLAIAKAHDGNVGALGRLGIATKDTEGQTLSFDQVMHNATKTFGGSAANALDTTAGRSQAFKRDLGELQETIGAQLLPIIAKLTEWLAKIVTWFSNLSPGVQKAIVAVAGIAAGLVILNSVLGGATAAAAAFGITLNLSLGPIALIVAAIAGLIAIGVLLVKNWDTIKGAASSVWRALHGVWDGLKQGFKDAFNWIIDRWNSFKIPGIKVAGVSVSPEINFPNLPRFHGGGVVPGPAGADVVGVLRAGERVLPVGASGGVVLNLVVNGFVGDNVSLVRALKDALVRDTRLGGPAIGGLV